MEQTALRLIYLMIATTVLVVSTTALYWLPDTVRMVSQTIRTALGFV